MTPPSENDGGDERQDSTPGPQLGPLQLLGEIYRILRGKEPKHEIESRDLDEHYDSTPPASDLSWDDVTLAELQALPFDEFEELVGELYEQRGYDVELTPPGPDDGLDVIARKAPDSVGIQAKRYQDENRVTARTIRATHGAASQRNLQRAAVATTSSFSSSAEEAASGLSIELISGRDIITELDGE